MFAEIRQIAHVLGAQILVATDNFASVMSEKAVTHSCHLWANRHILGNNL